MAAALRQAYKALSKVSGSITTVTGDVVLVTMAFNNSAGTIAIADTALNSWTQVGTGSQDSTNAGVSQNSWTCVANASGTTVITVTSANTTSPTMFVEVISGCPSSGYLENYSFSAAEGSASTTHTTGSVSASAGDYVVAIMMTEYTGTNFTNTSGFTNLTTNAGNVYSNVFGLATSGSVSVTATSSSTYALKIIFAFKSGDASASPTGVSGTGSIHAPSPNTNVNVSATGVSSTGSVHAPLAGIGPNVTVTGVSGTGSVNAPSPHADVNNSVSGVSGTGSVHAPTAGIGPNVAATGVSSTGSVNAPSATATVNVSVTGVAGTGNVNAPSAQGAANSNVTGVSGTGSVNNPSPTATVNASVTGVTSTGSVNAPTVTADANTSVLGVASTGSVNAPTANGGGATDANAYPAGVSAIGSVGQPTVDLGIGDNQPGHIFIINRKRKKRVLRKPLILDIDDNFASFAPIEESETIQEVIQEVAQEALPAVARKTIRLSVGPDKFVQALLTQSRVVPSVVLPLLAPAVEDDNNDTAIRLLLLLAS